MDQRIAEYLHLSYRRDVLGEQVIPDDALQADAAYVTALQAELERIRKICSSRDLPNRDFAAYQNAKAIERALAKLGTPADAVL